MKLSGVIEELVEEKGLDRDLLKSVICEGVLSAFQKKYPELVLTVEYEPKNDNLAVMVQKTVVSSVKDENSEISVRRAHLVKDDVEAGDTLMVPFEGAIGRIEILRAKQLIASRIQKIEADKIFNEFKDKEGSIVNGFVHKCERAGIVVKLRDYLAFLPKSLSIPGESCAVGMPIKALLKEVLPEPRNENQLILDRVSTAFLARLFELEIPEVFERLVEIKKAVRIPGYKSKVIVISHDKNIDPVGTCVGIGGVRIKPILKELNGEKIDIISWNESLEGLVADALKPARVNRVELVDSNTANVWVDEDQRSLSIGRMGQNIALASKLVGVDIHLVQTSDFAPHSAAFDDEVAVQREQSEEQSTKED